MVWGSSRRLRVVACPAGGLTKLDNWILCKGRRNIKRVGAACSLCNGKESGTLHYASSWLYHTRSLEGRKQKKCGMQVDRWLASARRAIRKCTPHGSRGRFSEWYTWALPAILGLGLILHFHKLSTLSQSRDYLTNYAYIFRLLSKLL